MSHPHESSEHPCTTCDVGPFARNHYFTGKLLVERDFSDEQRYYIDKLRHHHQRLHGWGVVCGLAVTPHDTEGCRDRYLCVEPGTAVDCCGHEIVVRARDCVDFTRFESVRALRDEIDHQFHTLQVCLRYRECPAEDIPVLYDECSCDDVRCAPNRILESYDIDLIVDPPPAADTVRQPRLEWSHTVAVARARRVAVHGGTGRLYVLTSDAPGTLYAVDTANHTVVGAHVLPAAGLELAVSADGGRLYVVVEPADPTTEPRRLRVVDASDLALPPVQTIDIPDSVGTEVALAIGPDPQHALLATVSAAGTMLIWASDIDAGGAQPAAPASVPLGSAVTGLALGSSGGTAYTIGTAAGDIRVVDVTNAAALAPIAVLPAGAAPTVLAAARSIGPDLLVVAEQGNRRVHLVKAQPPTLVQTVELEHEPVALTTSLNGHWLYVVERQAGGDASFVQAVDLSRAQQGVAVVAGTPLPVGEASVDVARSEAGDLLYVAYGGAAGAPGGGGVAILEVSEEACHDILWRDQAECPACDEPNCLVLATIEGYRPGFRLEAMQTPPTDPAVDRQNGIARIDNRRGRRVLPSVQLLAEAFECATRGGEGPPGPEGPEGPQGNPGPAGPAGPGLEEGLTRIKALSWEHNSAANDLMLIKDTNLEGIAIAFTAPVRMATIDAAHVFQVHAPSQVLAEADVPATVLEFGFLCRCPVLGHVYPVECEFDPNQPTRIVGATRINAAEAEGVAFAFDPRTIIWKRLISQRRVPELWVQLRGDFVLDAKGKAIDAEYVRGELPTGDRPKPTPPAAEYGIQGGLFESWFRFPESIPIASFLVDTAASSIRVPVRTASREELMAVRGIGARLADRILAFRRRSPLESLADLRRVSGITDDIIAEIRDRISFD